MHLGKALKIFLPLALIAGLIYFAYPVINERYFGNGKTIIENNSPMDTTQPAPDNLDDMMTQDNTAPDSSDMDKLLSGEKPQEKAKSPINVNERKVPAGETLARITTEHCDNNCSAFTLDLKLREYCEQVCGIIPIKDVSGCDDKKDLEKDYCLKDLAINKKDSSLCGQIQDANIKLTCQNRILQDIIEGQ